MENSDSKPRFGRPNYDGNRSDDRSFKRRDDAVDGNRWGVDSDHGYSDNRERRPYNNPNRFYSNQDRPRYGNGNRYGSNDRYGNRDSYQQRRDFPGRDGYDRPSYRRDDRDSRGYGRRDDRRDWDNETGRAYRSSYRRNDDGERRPYRQDRDDRRPYGQEEGGRRKRNAPKPYGYDTFMSTKKRDTADAFWLKNTEVQKYDDEDSQD